eukprot:671026-Ditylum_brightwellii.AAC.1
MSTPPVWLFMSGWTANDASTHQRMRCRESTSRILHRADKFLPVVNVGTLHLSAQEGDAGLDVRPCSLTEKDELGNDVLS